MASTTDGAGALAKEGPSALIYEDESELRLLKTGEYSDFTVACGESEWLTHKAILSKVPGFVSCFESKQAKLVIEEFRPFEVEILLKYAYFPHINVTRIQEEAWQDDEQDDNDDDKKDNQREDDHTETQSDGQLNKVSSGRQSCLETLVRLCFLAHCYQFKSLSREALSILEQRTKNMCGEISTGPSDERITNITNELKDAIREAWKPGGAEIQVRDSLLQLSMAMSRHLGLQESFLALVDEVPTFAVDFSKATLSFFSSDAADQAKHVFHSAIKPPATSALPLVPAPAPLLFGSPASGRLLRVPTRRQIGASAILAPTSTSGAHVSSGLLLGSSSANGGEVSKAATPSLWAPSSTPYANKPTVLSFATKPTALSFESPSADGEVASRAVGVHQGDEANGDAPGPLGANIAAVRPVVRNEPSSSMQESFQNIASQNPFKFF